MERAGAAGGAAGAAAAVAVELGATAATAVGAGSGSADSSAFRRTRPFTEDSGTDVGVVLSRRVSAALSLDSAGARLAAG